RTAYSRAGTIAWEADFGAWGDATRTRTAAGGGTDEVRLRFPGQYEDAETGLCYNRFRYYDPELRGYTQADPIGLNGGGHPHGYVKDPVAWVDPYGLSPAPEYDPVDSLGRPQGAYVQLTPSDLRPTDTSPPTFNPPGWVGGQHPHHQQRSHLIADTFGGSGSDPRNLVALTDGANHPGMSKLEGQIRRHVAAGNTVDMIVAASYQGSTLTPHSISMYAVDQNGRVVVDANVLNGLRQRVRCCP
ncbi:MAG TPA: RHS repeat-associated core domain-containing protein, partial [Longimicrobium sp.]|nr:RHS repeat-associated core domain-containing protein [Longimicrobium sp.]